MPKLPSYKHAWLKALRGRRDLSNADFRLLVMLSTYTDEDGKDAFPGPRRLADDIGVKDVDSVRARCSDLARRGYLVVATAGGTTKGGERVANVFELSLPPDLTPGAHDGGTPGAHDGGSVATPPVATTPPPRVVSTVTPPSPAQVPPRRHDPTTMSLPDQLHQTDISVEIASRSTASRSTPSAEPLPDNWEPNTTHRASMRDAELDPTDVVDSFKAKMIGQKRRNWDRTLGGFIRAVVDGREDVVFHGDEGDDDDALDPDVDHDILVVVDVGAPTTVSTERMIPSTEITPISHSTLSGSKVNSTPTVSGSGEELRLPVSGDSGGSSDDDEALSITTLVMADVEAASTVMTQEITPTSTPMTNMKSTEIRRAYPECECGASPLSGSRNFTSSALSSIPCTIQSTVEIREHYRSDEASGSRGCRGITYCACVNTVGNTRQCSYCRVNRYTVSS